MIKDSGNRTEFESGAVRDIQIGKGRADLLPMDIVDETINGIFEADVRPLQCIDQFQEDGDYTHLLNAVYSFVVLDGHLGGNIHNAMIEYSIHLEEGSNKYGDRNWQKGIPLRNYISSATRHYLKYLRGDTDERHDRAFVWNCMCGAWTAKHLPDLNEYMFDIIE